LAAQLATNPKDQVIAISVRKDDTADRFNDIANHCKQHFSTHQGKFVKVDSHGKVTDDILKFVNENTEILADFVIFGNNGLKAEMQINYGNTLGSTADELISKALANLILIP